MARYFWPLLFGLGGVAILVWLGVWQLQRLAWKEGILAEIEARIAAEPVALPDTPDPETDRYLPVRVDGRIGTEFVRVLVSTRRDGAGYRIVSTFETDGRTILLDWGFMSVDEDEPVGGYDAAVIGNLHWPDEVTRSTPEPNRLARLWYARDVPEIAAALGAEPILVIAREIDPGQGPTRPLPVSTEGIPNDHLEYAGTWFSLAVFWLGMTLYLLWRINRRII